MEGSSLGHSSWRVVATRAKYASVGNLGQGLVVSREKDVLVITHVVLGLPNASPEPGTLVYLLG
jgi:hypothetical protein